MANRMKAFTSVELLIVVVILGMVAMIVISQFRSVEEQILSDKLRGAQKVIVETQPDGNAYTIKILVSAEETIHDVPKTRFNPEKLKEHGFEQADTSEPGKQLWIRPARDIRNITGNGK